MASDVELQETGELIQSVLDDLGRSGTPRQVAAVQEIISGLGNLYGAGLEHMLEAVRRSAADPDVVLEAMVADGLVANLLILHGLHPVDARTRVEHALTTVRPYLESHGGDVELVDVDLEAGAVQLRLHGTCKGCPSSTATLQYTVETAIRDAAPEIETIDVAGLALPDIADEDLIALECISTPGAQP